MLSPLNEYTSPTPATVSVGFERGLPYWPAMRAIGTAFRPVDASRSELIWSMSLSWASRRSPSQSRKRSAQSPPWMMKASPRAALASSSVSASTSSLCTSGGTLASLSTTVPYAALSSYSAICRLSYLRHESLDHVRLETSATAAISTVAGGRAHGISSVELDRSTSPLMRTTTVPVSE